MTPVLRKRSGVVAALLAYFVPLVGFAYVQRPGWGVAFALLAPVLMLIAGWLGIPFAPSGYFALLALLLVALIASLVIAFRFSRQVPVDAKPRWYNRWYHYAWMAALTLILGYFVGSNRGNLFGYEPFRIPATSMQPALALGDFIVVDFRDATMATIQRGDIVVFDPPHHPGQQWIKRVVGLPGEMIEVRGNNVAVNGALLTNAWGVVTEPVHEGAVPFGEVRLQADEFFLMGDNRPNSEDSRYMGPIKRDALRGKARSIWFHYSPTARSIDLSRIGRIESAPDPD